MTRRRCNAHSNNHSDKVEYIQQPYAYLAMKIIEQAIVDWETKKSRSAKKWLNSEYCKELEDAIFSVMRPGGGK